MGVVFLAIDVALQRRVAVKVIHPELVVNLGLAARFLAEARLIARPRHPHIVAVHAGGEAAGHLYYVMDFHEGETLRQRLLRDHRLDGALAVSIAADIAEDAAATAGVVHRDLKPENILLEGPPHAPRALLADFGIARRVDGVDGHTGPHAVMGTPAYMGPEPAGGEALDSRSDLYSLGVVAYEMLAGEPPFVGPTRVVVSRQLVDTPQSLAERCPELPRCVTDAVMHALAKTPEERWQSGAGFRRALQGEPTPVELPRPHRRSRRLFTVAAAILLVVAAGWVVRGRELPPHGANPRLSLLVLPFDNLRDEAALHWLQDGSGAARKALTDSNGKGREPDQKTDAVYLGFAWNDTRPLEAEARYQLGDYRGTLDLLESFTESQLYRRRFDSRWGLLGRIHLSGAWRTNASVKQVGQPPSSNRWWPRGGAPRSHCSPSCSRRRRGWRG